MATGTEVAATLEAWENADRRGNRSAPWSACRPGNSSGNNPGDYRDQVFPSQIKARVAVEAASPFGWREYVGDAGIVIGMNRWRVRPRRSVDGEIRLYRGQYRRQSQVLL